MKNKLIAVSITFVFIWHFNSCNPGTSADHDTIAMDSVTLAAGEGIFNKHCSGCHNFRQDAIGPQLGGLTKEVPASWIEHFIKDPQQLIGSGDERAIQLFKKYKVVMPSFAIFTDHELKPILAFLNSQKKTIAGPAKQNGKELPNPIPGTILSSDIVIELQAIAQFPASSDSGKLPLTRITRMDFQPNTKKIYVLDLRGKLYNLQNNRPLVFMDMAKLKPKFINEPGLGTGFGSFAFDPGYAKNGLIYTTHTEQPGSAKADFAYNDSIKVTLQWVVTQWKANNPASGTFSGKGRELFRVNMVSGIHGMQEITFNPFSKPGFTDYGMLYIGIGDGGCVEGGYPFLAHSKDKVWGTIFRIDPKGTNSANKKYGIPANNPFVMDQDPATLREIYAYGFRNPHRITWSKAGKMLASNIGHGNIESLNLIVAGNDYGWPVREGTFLLDPYSDLNKVYSLPSNDSIYHITYPVAQYDHDEGKAISGGYEYSGTNIPLLKGKFVFGDIPTGRLFYINMADIRQGKQARIMEWKASVDGISKTLRELCGTDRVDLHFGRDAQGELYLMTKPDGKVYQLMKAVSH